MTRVGWGYRLFAVHGLQPRLHVVVRERLQRQRRVLVARAQRHVEAEAPVDGVRRSTSTRHKLVRLRRYLAIG